MKKIQVIKAHNFNMRDKNIRVVVRNKINSLIVYLQKQYNIDSVWVDTNRVDFKCRSGIANGLQGVLSIDQNYISIDIDLPFTMIALGDALKSAIEDKMNEFIKSR